MRRILARRGSRRRRSRAQRELARHAPVRPTIRGAEATGRTGRTVGVLLAVAALLPAAASAAPGDLYVTDLNSFGGKGALVRVDPATGGQTVISSGGGFQEPTGVAVTDDGTIYVVDSDAFGGPCQVGCGGVIRVDPASGAQTTVSAGNAFVNPTGIALAPSGDLLVADRDAGPSSLGALIRVNPATGAQSIVSQGQSFDAPSGVTVAADGAFLVADANAGGPSTGALIRVDPQTGAQQVVSIGGAFVNPSGVTLQGRSVLIVDDEAFGGGALFRDASGSSQPVVSSGDKFGSPHGLVVTPTGQVFVADRGAGAAPGSVFRIDTGSGQQTAVSTGGVFVDPYGIAVDPRPAVMPPPPPPPPTTTATTTPTATTPPPKAPPRVLPPARRLAADARLRASPLRDGVRVRFLKVTAPPGARISVSCLQRRCRRFARTVPSRGSGAQRVVTVGTLANRVLRAGTRVRIVVTRPGFIGTFVSYTIRRGDFDKVGPRCLAPGSRTPRPCG